MRFRVLFITFASVFLCLTNPVHAQEAVKVRTGSHDEYSRLVFEWPSKPQYSVSKEGGRILVRFGKAGTPDVSGVDPSAKNISKVETISKEGESLQMGVTIPDGSRFRDFMVENKLIIDVYNSDGAAAPAKAEEPVKEPEPVKVVEVPEPVKEPAAADSEQDFSIKPAESANPAPLTQVEAAKMPVPEIGSHVISLTATTGFGMAVFERSGMLWLIVDTKDAGLAPQLTGPQKAQFGSFTKVALPEGIAYRMDLPEGVQVQTQGGGLGWQIILSTKAKNAKGVEPQRSNDEGKLVWPLSEMRKVITFTDPVVGDKVVVVTASQADQLAGAPRQFVHLETLNSFAGLAFVPHVDDISTEVTLKTVIVGRPDGLALAAEKDSQPAAIREATKQQPETIPATETPPVTPAETEEAKPAEGADKSKIASAIAEPPPTNNIYNFQRWEMGGVRELNNNQHVMMLDGAGKKANELAETMIALAKLNLANDRAPEALGLLRIALQSVPELKDNPEFIALRAAAFALSSKYDEAMTDYTDERLKPFLDVKYWNAYTLAGLEDWAQAFEKMPPSFEIVETYPLVIRAPLMLTFAEIALRGGKVGMAKDILAKLEPHLKELPLTDSASWNYLMGEAERQAGNAAKAEEYWAPLVKNGKDDLFRAKAGLSLTKLQLDEKKIKPAEAVDRLEGLRYAWRGDELETLVNYRLGQMYIENKDYLKGFTVLRNADTLSPETDLGRTVNEYMNKKFREVFNNNILKDMSPLDAISLYEEFKDLVPAGEAGDNFADKLAERLVEADLLGRASALLEYQVNHRLKGEKRAEVAIRLAAIRLLDGNPDGALRSLEIAQDVLNKVEPSAGTAPTEAPPAEAVKPDEAKTEDAQPAPENKEPTATLGNDSEKQRQINLLKARALSMKNKTDEAMAILDKMRLDADVNRLRADITWSAGRWEDAAVALNDLLVMEDISAKRPLTQYQTDLILNRGIALNLSNNRVALANLRDRYNAQMKATDKGSVFEIVTRARQPDMVGSRESIEKMISEIDFFRNFLDGYSKLTDGPKKDEKPTAPATPAPAADGAKPAEAPATDAAKEPAPSPEAKPVEKAVP